MGNSFQCGDYSKGRSEDQDASQQKEDKLVIGSESFKRRYMNVGVSEDERFEILSAANATNGNELYIREANKKSDFIFSPLNV